MDYILRYTGTEQPDAEVIQQVLRANHIPILDGSSLPKMVLVGGVMSTNLQGIQAELPSGWEFFPMQDQKYRVPDTRPKVIKK
jgi:hypothetical protein